MAICVHACVCAYICILEMIFFLWRKRNSDRKKIEEEAEEDRKGDEERMEDAKQVTTYKFTHICFHLHIRTDTWGREKETEEWLQNDNEKLKMSTFDQKEDDNKRTSEWTNEWTMWMNAEKERERVRERIETWSVHTEHRARDEWKSQKRSLNNMKSNE